MQTGSSLWWQARDLQKKINHNFWGAETLKVKRCCCEVRGKKTLTLCLGLVYSLLHSFMRIWKMNDFTKLVHLEILYVTGLLSATIKSHQYQEPDWLSRSWQGWIIKTSTLTSQIKQAMNEKTKTEQRKKPSIRKTITNATNDVHSAFMRRCALCGEAGRKGVTWAGRWMCHISDLWKRPQFVSIVSINLFISCKHNRLFTNSFHHRNFSMGPTTTTTVGPQITETCRGPALNLLFKSSD